MKRVILKAQTLIKETELKVLAKDLNEQWDQGFMVVPDFFKVELVDEGWTAVEDDLPEPGRVCLVWMSYEDNGKTCQTYGFAKHEGDGWVVYLQKAKKILAWTALPAPYEVRK